MTAVRRLSSIDMVWRIGVCGLAGRCLFCVVWLQQVLATRVPWVRMCMHLSSQAHANLNNPSEAEPRAVQCSVSEAEAVPSHCLPPRYTPTSTFRARSTRTPEKPQPTLAPLEASERNLSNEPKELSSPPAQAQAQRRANLPKLQDARSPWGHSGTVGARPGAGDRESALTSPDLPSLW
eukprot:scaffold1708_cov117-Isochrysis_galbana.AAC.5